MNLKRNVGIVLVNLAILFLLTELFSAAYLTIKKPYLRKFEYTPTYLDFTVRDRYVTLQPEEINPRIIDSTIPWGIWHIPNVMSRHRTNCFDVVMKYNRYGARGPMPDAGDAENIIFLGDSFTEGFGLSEEETIPAQLSRLTGRPTINLGVSRSGSTQQALIYRNFADSFRHRDVFMLIHLENDLTDNDFDQHDTVLTKYFKPYRADSSHLNHIAYRGHPDSSSMNSKRFSQHFDEYRKILVKKGLASHMQSDNYTVFGRIVRLTYSRRVLELFNNYQESREQMAHVPLVLGWREKDVRILTYDMQQVMEEADKHGARVTFINLPGQALIGRLATHPENRANYLALENRLRQAANHGSHSFQSLFTSIEQKKPDLKTIFFTCDGHYSPAGAAMVSTFLSTRVSQYTRPTGDEILVNRNLKGRTVAHQRTPNSNN